MKGRIVALFAALLFLMPVAMFSNASEEKAKVEIFDFYGNKIGEKEMSTDEIKSFKKDILDGNFCVAGLKFDFGFGNYIISYGKGKVYIPFSRERSFIRLMLRPIFFHYEKGFTLVKFGANYIWRGKSIGDYGMMFRNQYGMMLGFLGVHIRIRHKLQPDTHIFVGNALLIAGKDKLL
jgi:hypothetical protein